MVKAKTLTMSQTFDCHNHERVFTAFSRMRECCTICSNRREIYAEHGSNVPPSISLRVMYESSSVLLAKLKRAIYMHI